MTAPKTAEVELYLSMLHRAVLGAPILITSEGDPMAVLAQTATPYRPVEEMVAAIIAARDREESFPEEPVGAGSWYL